MAERRVAQMINGDTPTLFEAPLDESGTGDVVLMGVPYEGILVADRHTLYPPGARPTESIYSRFGADEAPDAIRRASVIYSLEHDGGIAAELDFTCLTDGLRIIDAGNHTLESAETVARKAGHAGGVTIALGGDHLVPLPLIRGLQKGKARKLGVVIFDSHLDLHPSPPQWAGSQWRSLIEERHLDPENIVIIGPRGVRQSLHEIAYARENGVTVIPLQHLDEQGIDAVCKKACDVLKDVDAVYVSLDIDVVDPGFCPAQKYPDAAGMTPREVLTVMRKSTMEKPIAGFDVCCFSPRYDENQRGALVAARFALEAVYACKRS
jgi:arginase family enzyme